jgi:hypothetical protein
MEPAAADFLELARELGHLDEVAIERLTGALVSRGPRRALDLREMRCQVAIAIFGAEEKLRPEQRELLAAEWARLFG